MRTPKYIHIFSNETTIMTVRSPRELHILSHTTGTYSKLPRTHSDLKAFVRVAFYGVQESFI
jgi:hypothetical protein